MENQFFIGQKVECGYYHEYKCSYEKDIYKRSLISKIIDNPFEPVKFGVIVGSAGFHKYWMSNRHDKKEEYLLVRFREYYLPKLIPISCICDLKEMFKIYENHIDKFFDKSKKEDISKSSYIWYQKIIHTGKEYLNLKPNEIKIQKILF